MLKHYVLSRRAGALIRTISWICMGGISIGIFSLIVVISVMNGFNRSLTKRLLAIEPHLVIPFDSSHTASFWKNLQVKLDQIPGAKAHVFESQDVIVRTADGFISGAVAKGMSTQALTEILKTVSEQQHKDPDPDVHLPPDIRTLKPGQVLLGADLAMNLGVFEGSHLVAVEPEALLLPPGEMAKFQKIKVVGTLSTNVSTVDSKMIYYVRGKSFRDFRGSASYRTGLEVRFADPAQASVIQDKLRKQGVKSQTWMQRNSALFYALKLEKTAIGLFLSLSALIASFSIVAVLMLLMTQKRRDIGVLMALGLSRRQTQWSFVKIGMALSLVGIFSGLVGGVVLSELIARYPVNVLPAIYHDRSIPASVNYWFVFWVACAGILVAFISAWIPARKNAMLMPAEALRSSLNSSKH